MAISIKYVGPLDQKKAAGVIFSRLQPVSVADDVAHKLLGSADVFMPADAEVPADVLALREKLGHALIKEGRDRLRNAQKMLISSEDLPDGDKRQQAYKELSIKNANEEIAHAERLTEKGQAWLVKVKAEGAEAFKTDDDGEPVEKPTRKRKSFAEGE